MNRSILNTLLQEYDAKRTFALLKAERKKEDLYEKFPELQKIEEELAQTSISIAKSILASNDSTHLTLLQKNIESLKGKKQDLLKKLDITVQDLSPRFECSICEDTGFILENNSNVMCNCLKQKLFNLAYNQSNMGNIQNDTFANFNLDFYSDEINESLYKTNISPRKNMQIIKEVALSFVKNFEQPTEKNLLFRGNTGLGKTFLSNCIANEVLNMGKTVLYQTAPIMFDMILDYRFGKNLSVKNICDNILTVDLLIIDDLGTEHMNSAKFSELFNIINSRLLNNNHSVTKTIISTNLTMNELFKNYDERIVSRLVGNYNILPFFGEDIRFKKKV